MKGRGGSSACSMKLSSEKSRRNFCESGEEMCTECGAIWGG